MLKLKSLRLSGIGRFVEPQNVMFEELGNLVQVDGENRNTGGSSGSGKSTLFNALDYLLGLNDLPITVLQSRLTKEAISVRGEFDYNGKVLLITRNKRGLIIDNDGVVTEGSSKLAEEELDKILGMSRDLFRKILHKRQKEGGFFLEFTPKKMYEFLTDCLNLSAERKKMEIVDSELTKLEKLEISTNSSLEASKAALKATQDNILALGLAPVRDIHQQVILDLKTKADSSALALAQIEADHKRQNELLDKDKPELIPTPKLEVAEQLPAPTLESTDLGNGPKITELKNKIQELQELIATLKEKENLRVREIKDKIQSHKMTVMALEHKCSLANTAKNEAVKVAGEIKKIRDAICPMCEQSWVTETAKVKENEFLTKLAAYKQQIADGSTAEQTIASIKEEIKALEDQIDSTEQLAVMNGFAADVVAADSARIAEEEMARKYSLEITVKNNKLIYENTVRQNEINAVVLENNKKVIAEIEAKNKILQETYHFKVTAVRQAQNHEITQARGQADVDKRTFDAAVNKLKTYEDARARYESSLNTMKISETKHTEDVNKYTAILADTLNKKEKASELKKAIKTYLSYSFDGALESISEVATRIIRNIPTMANATIQFEGQKETQEGKIKEEVNAVISMDGDIGIPIKSLSGGERSAVDLAVDLAVIEFIELETNKGIDLFILDEPFTGLDTVGIEMALEVLKNSNSNKRLIVVDHNPEVKQLVTNRIVVVREGSTSTVSQEVENV